MTNSLSCSDGLRCTRADALLGVEGVHVSSATATPGGLVLGVETGQDITGCLDCGVVAVRHGRRQVRLHDIPCFGRPVRLLWAKRVWRCPDRDCPRTTVTEEHPLAGPRAKLTSRAVNWATRCTPAFRHLGLGTGPPTRRLLAHRLARNQGRGRAANR